MTTGPRSGIRSRRRKRRARAVQVKALSLDEFGARNPTRRAGDAGLMRAARAWRKSARGLPDHGAST